MTDQRADLRFGTIPRMALSSAKSFGREPAVIDGEVELSFVDVAEQMKRIARSLLASGVQPGDRIALWAPNSAAWITSALGILATGAWLVPINTRFRGAEAAYILQRTDSRSLFVVDEFLGVDYLAMLRSEAPELRAYGEVIKVPSPGEADASGWATFLEMGDGVPFAEVEQRIAKSTADDVSDVIFTSGTTGSPKGVMLRHGASLRCYESYNLGFGIGPGDRHMIAAPFFHCFGYKAGWMLSLMVGATTIPVSVFSAEDAMTSIERHRVTHMPGAPTMYTALLSHPDREHFDLSSLRTAIVSAASIPESLVYQMRDDLGIEHVMTGYGLTENHALGSFTLPGDPPSVVATSAGKPAPGVEMKIVDDVGVAQPSGAAGEILIRGYSLMTGYYADPAATDAVLSDGWLRTGDIGTLDESGYLRITDRKKDIYVMGGFNVAPAEVESVLRNLAGVEQVAVVGMSDEHFGEIGVAFVVLVAGADLSRDEVTEYARRASGELQSASTRFHCRVAASECNRQGSEGGTATAPSGGELMNDGRGHVVGGG